MLDPSAVGATEFFRRVMQSVFKCHGSKSRGDKGSPFLARAALVVIKDSCNIGLDSQAKAHNLRKSITQ